MYDPAQGRFLSRDTWAYDTQNPVELNRYGYAANNPVRWMDPSGNEFVQNVIIHLKNGFVTRPLYYVGSNVISTISGTIVAFNARIYIDQLRQLLQNLPNWVMSQVTIATGYVNGQLTIAINSNVPRMAVKLIETWQKALESQGIKLVFEYNSSHVVHAEIALYKYAADIAVRTGVPLQQVLPAIAISNTTGPCGPDKMNCLRFFQELSQQLAVPLFWIGK